MLGQLNPAAAASQRPAGTAAARPRPTLQSRNVDFDSTWGAVEQLTGEVLADPLARPSLNLMQAHHKVYVIAGGQCTGLPDWAQSFVDAHRQQQSGGASASKGAAVSVYVELLHSLLTKRIREHLNARLQPLSRLSGNALLASYHREWRSYCLSVKTLSAAFGYVHTHWATGTTKDGTRTLAEQQWREVVYEGVKAELVRACLVAVAQDREGATADTATVRGVLESLCHLSPQPSRPQLLYQSHFEANYLRKLEDYLNASLLRIRQDAGGDARRELVATAHLLRGEIVRVQRLLHPSTVKPVTRVISSVVGDADARRTVAELGRLVEAGANSELEDLYWLARHRDNGVPMLAAELAGVVERSGRAAVDATTGPVAFVAAAAKAYGRFDSLVATVLERDAALTAAVRDGSSRFLNRNAHSAAAPLAPAEHLAAFTHIALRTGSGAARAELEASFPNVDAAIDAAVQLLRLLDDRDVFQARFASYLATRIISGACAQDNELLLINAVARVTSHDFCYKWRRMLTDIDRSVALRQSFKPQGLSSDAAGIEFKPLVATQGSWPLVLDRTRVLLPGPVEALAQAFQGHFVAQDQQKRLNWLHMQTVAVVRPLYTKRRYELTTSLAQLWLLLALDPHFGGSAEAEIPAVAERSGLPVDVLQRALAVLLRARVVAPATPAAQPGALPARFALNTSYAPAALKVNLHAAKEAPSASGAAASPASPVDAVAAEATQRVVQDRKFAVQAAIVRVAKSRRTVRFGDLVTDVIAQLRGSVFTPTMQLVKTNIEALIDKEYLERSADDNDTLNYVA